MQNNTEQFKIHIVGVTEGRIGIFEETMKIYIQKEQGSEFY